MRLAIQSSCDEERTTRSSCDRAGRAPRCLGAGRRIGWPSSSASPGAVCCCCQQGHHPEKAPPFPYCRDNTLLHTPPPAALQLHAPAQHLLLMSLDATNAVAASDDALDVEQFEAVVEVWSDAERARSERIVRRLKRETQFLRN